MDTLVRLNADELTPSFVEFIKNSFKGKRIALHIYEDAVDETEYLLNDETHKKKLLETVAEINKQEPTKVYTLNELKGKLVK